MNESSDDAGGDIQGGETLQDIMREIHSLQPRMQTPGSEGLTDQEAAHMQAAIHSLKRIPYSRIATGGRLPSFYLGMTP